MEFWVTLIVTIITAILASTGLWAFIQKRFDRKDNKARMLLGLGHDRILYLGMKYITRGWITKDEYENLYEYLYKPYEEMGGNGSAKRIMKEIDRLPIKDSTYGGKEVIKKPINAINSDEDEN